MLDELFKGIYLVSISIGVFTGLNLIMHQGDKKIHSLLLFLVGLLLVPPLNGYVQLISNKPVWWLISFSQNLTWAYGPLLLLSVQLCLLKPVKPSAMLIHLTPYLLINLFRLFSTPIPSLSSYLFLSLIIQTATYCLFSIYYSIKNKSKIKMLLSGHRNTTYFWLLYLSLGLLLIALLDIGIVVLLISGYTINFDMVSIAAVAISIYVCLIALFSIYQPDVFFTVEESITNLQNHSTQQLHPLRNVELSPEAAKDLGTKLKSLSAKLKFHLDESISLDKLASLLGISRNQLSELLNVYNETTFYHYINQLRFEESLKLMDQKHLTIADIAYQAGFNNRNSFYKVFKRNTGLTPKEYRVRSSISKN